MTPGDTGASAESAIPRSAPPPPAPLQRLREGLLRLRYPRSPRWLCPVCGYRGPLQTVRRSTGVRRHARCPRCRSLERHRLQHLVMRRVLAELDTARISFIHFAPEAFFRGSFARRFGRYTTADLMREDVDVRADLCDLPFEEASFDFVYASHVLEHIRDDRRAIAGIARILRPGGLAVLPVPIVGETTIEYPAPNPHEVCHWRAPGLDYPDRLRPFFAAVDVYDSDMFPPEHQVHVYEDRADWPTARMPLRRPVAGERHVDLVPVCRR